MIELDRLRRTFGDNVALEDLSLKVESGELFGFLGPNGAGKTTTIRMLSGLLRPTSGRVVIDGQDYERSADQLRRSIGLVPDTPPLYEYLTGNQYIAFVASLDSVDEGERLQRSRPLLEQLGLGERADDLCKSYSHGMRKKIHITAVLTTRPKVLLLDEPTSGLDPRSARILKDLLLGARDQGTTIFLSTHRLETAEEICDRVAILGEGKLLAVGTMDELKSSRNERSLEQVFLRLVEESEGSDEEAAAS